MSRLSTLTSLVSVEVLVRHQVKVKVAHILIASTIHDQTMADGFQFEFVNQALHRLE